MTTAYSRGCQSSTAPLGRLKSRTRRVYEPGGPASAPLGGVLGDPRNQASLLRGRESAPANRAKGRARGLGEGAQTRLSEVAECAACFMFLAHRLVCSWECVPDNRAIMRASASSFKSRRGRKLSKFRQDQIAEICEIPRLSVQRCQSAQRLSISVHRDDAHASCVTPRFLRVFPSRNQEDVGSGAPRADRLLLEAPDRGDRAVEAHLTGRDHPV